MEITEDLKTLYRLKKVEISLEKEGVLEKLSPKDKLTISAAITSTQKEKKEEHADGLAKNK